MTPKWARGTPRRWLRRLAPAALVAVAVAAIAAEPGPGQPRYTAAGALVRPADVDRWILVGTSLGLGYSDVTEDGPGMFHRVYLEPTAYDHYRRNGRFRTGTMLALVIRHPERRVPPGKSGWTEGELAAVEMAVKDPERFAGGWAYFDFGRRGATAATLPPARCARCHAQHAALDNVFLQFYPQLRDR